MKGKHGKILSWVTVWKDETEGKYKGEIQKATASDGSEVIHIKKPISPKEQGWGFTLFQPHYSGIKAEIQELVGIYGKEEVERELGIKIGGETNGRV